MVLLHTINSGKKVIFLNGNQIFEEELVSCPWVCAAALGRTVRDCAPPCL